ncbi:glutathione S-transferase family protein [Alteromonas sp. a30]|uniref:glutathione S-transferase family protein n=1 Tax=Alteromonas sp. a30 TaxID=2730917 RepID=UPI0022802907|nr:glutathione S-transferase [Alteromonas sp. a30]MCY7295201.1 glutathione S-transferase [Alteromonas sp. a30]
MSNITLHRHPVSGHAHRAELFLSLLGLDFTLQDVDLMKGAHKQPDFLALNPFGQIPVLIDGDVTLFDSNAILVYLAKTYDKSGQWLPEEPVAAAQVQQFLSMAAGLLAYGPARARLITLFNAPYDADATITQSHAFLTTFNAMLAGKEWLVGNHPTIADVAHYSYIAKAPEGNVDLSEYSNILDWLARIEALDGFVPMMVSKVGLVK